MTISTPTISGITRLSMLTRFAPMWMTWEWLLFGSI
jgi:hypothetical protein